MQIKIDWNGRPEEIMQEEVDEVWGDLLAICDDLEICLDNFMVL